MRSLGVFKISRRSTARSIHVARNVDEMRKYFRKNVLAQSKTAGFVPTMGALHSGHLTLMKQSKQENNISITSVFVNPTQFSPGEDFERYPRNLEKDVELMKTVGVDCVFAPETVEMYPNNRLCHVEPQAFSLLHEGRARPEFFRGVATIVTKLFNIVQPHVAYFGQKDVSQCILIRKMVEDLNIPVKVKIIETIRANDGLALSSRNAYLTESERVIANILYEGLSAGKKIIADASDGSSISSDVVIKEIERVIRTQPAVTRIEYISVASYIDMKELSAVDLNGTGAVLSSAIRLGNVRLIDNLLVGKANDLIR